MRKRLPVGKNHDRVTRPYFIPIPFQKRNRFRIGVDKCSIVRISEPIKSHFARTKELSLEELMSENEYKERYRVEMILWSDEVRKREPGYFCKAACEKGKLPIDCIVTLIGANRNCREKDVSFENSRSSSY